MFRGPYAACVFCVQGGSTLAGGAEQILLYLAEEQAEGAGLLCSFGGCSLLRDLPVLFGRAGAVLDCACGCCCQLLGRQGARQSLGTECWQCPSTLTRHAHLHRDECDATTLICYSCKQCKQRCKKKKICN